MGYILCSHMLQGTAAFNNDIQTTVKQAITVVRKSVTPRPLKIHFLVEKSPPEIPSESTHIGIGISGGDLKFRDGVEGATF